MNAYVGYRGGQFKGVPDPRYSNFLKTSDINTISTSDLMVFADVNPKSICRPLFGTYMDREVMLHFPASHHTGSGVFTFADGHIETHRWLDPRVINPRNSDFHGHNDPVPGSGDLKWLQARTTALRR
jgi:hypothetical protein